GSDKLTVHAAGSNTPIIYAARVMIQNSVFTPSDVTIMVSGSILWVNNDETVHTVTAKDGSFDSGDLQPGATFGVTFNTVGPHRYHCKYHAEMTGVVKCVTK
ncbi:MAG TPA: cupredoxin domain-containing protein, partial [Chitinophagaceae bacterium]